MFAVIRTGGKQYRVAADEMIRVDKIAGAPGDLVEFGEVLVVGGETPTLGTPTVSGATVAGEVIEQGRGDKVIAFKKRRRKSSRRKRGHRQEFTLVRITEILTEGKRPSPIERKAKPARQPVEAAAGEASEPAAADADSAPQATRGKASKSKAKPKTAAKAKAPAKKPAAAKKTAKGAKRGEKK
jgi:large subunit ribosomal protein L21